MLDCESYLPISPPYLPHISPVSPHISPSRRREKVLDCESIQMRSEMCRSESMGTW